MSEPAPQTATLAIMRQIVASTRFNVLTKTEVLACADGYAELSMPFDPSMTQHHGYLHGALIGYLADTAISWSAGSAIGDVVTSEFRVHILAPGKGERFIAKGQVVKAGRRQVVSRADIFAVSGGEEKLIAIATGTCIPVGQDYKKTSA
jgi:uncharacterized protein (TIGR00369 family)